MKLTIEDKIYIENNLNNENDIMHHFGFDNYVDKELLCEIKKYISIAKKMPYDLIINYIKIIDYSYYKYNSYKFISTISKELNVKNEELISRIQEVRTIEQYKKNEFVKSFIKKNPNLF